ncbi:ADP-ribose diphosphatase [Bacterioplanes sanyensis]|uniref:NUDIX domain-containing protein n=1 Tax=Bacterioplanes sanyensis TaxID=1249553 RepID=UPI001676D434|nr:NUDIX domain-containing protein [Bacterioplanes sanyensis]GGY50608.1 ADP-ribose diphosphatase [Bacterioplanes sanyensis]
MGALPTPFTQQDVELVDRQVAFRGFFTIEKLTLRHRRFNGEWLGPFQRELFRRGEAVGVLLFDPQRQQVVLTEQFRVGALRDQRSPWLLELVAGMVEEGEDYADVAQRETLEEAGSEFYQLIPICDYWVSPGGCDEKVMLYCGLVDSSNMGGVHGLDEEHEDIRLVTLTLDQAWQALDDGSMNNAATIIAMQWLRLNQERLLSELTR